MGKLSDKVEDFDILFDKVEDLDDKLFEKVEDLKELIGDKMSDMETENVDFAPAKFELAQEVNIDLDLGAGDLGQGSFLESLDFEWWGYALAGLGFVVIMIGKCMISRNSQS